MHLIKHRSETGKTTRGHGKGRLMSVVGADLVRVVAVAAWLDQLNHAEKRETWCAVWEEKHGFWRITYRLPVTTARLIDEFVKDYLSARKSVQAREFPGFRLYAGIKKQVLRPRQNRDSRN